MRSRVRRWIGAGYMLAALAAGAALADAPKWQPDRVALLPFVGAARDGDLGKRLNREARKLLETWSMYVLPEDAMARALAAEVEPLMAATDDDCLRIADRLGADCVLRPRLLGVHRRPDYPGTFYGGGLVVWTEAVAWRMPEGKLVYAPTMVESRAAKLNVLGMGREGLDRLARNVSGDLLLPFCRQYGTPPKAPVRKRK